MQRSQASRAVLAYAESGTGDTPSATLRIPNLCNATPPCREAARNTAWGLGPKTRSTPTNIISRFSREAEKD